MGARDAGWIQLYAENNQEAYDNYLQAMRIAETPDVRLPIMVCQDGFITSHAVENILLEEDEAVKAFVGEYHPEHALLGRETPLAVGPYDISPYYMEHKVQQAEAMKNAKRAVLDVAADFEKTFGRKYGFFEEYCMEDAEVALVLIGSTAGTAKACIDQLRAAGRRVGLIKIRVFRPFPGEELAQALSHVKAVAVMDKSEGFSACGGPLYAETCAACAGQYCLRSGRTRCGNRGYCPRVRSSVPADPQRRSGTEIYPHGTAQQRSGGALTWPIITKRN